MPVDVLQSTKLYLTLINKLDPNSQLLFKAIVDDLDYIRQNLLGIGRDNTEQLLIKNKPITNNQADVLVFLLNKLGQIALLQPEPKFGYANLDVGGPKHIFGTPPYAVFCQKNLVAGVGLYTWDTVIYNNEPDMFVRVTANTQIKITDRGHYRILAQVIVEHGATAITATILNVNGARVRSSTLVTGPAGNTFATHNLNWQQEFLPGDLIDVQLLTGTNRWADGATTQYNNIVVCRVN